MQAHRLFLCVTAPPLTWLDIQATLENNSERWISNTVQIDGYTIASLKATLRALFGSVIETSVDRVSNSNDYLDAGFPAPGRSRFVNLRHDF